MRIKHLFALIDVLITFAMFYLSSIGESAFKGCQEVESLYISSTIGSIGINAFADCDKIKEIKGLTSKVWVWSIDLQN